MGASVPAESSAPGGIIRPYAVASAARLMETEFAARWQARSKIGELSRRVLVAIHGLILSTAAPVPVAAIAAAMPGESPSAVGEAVAALDEGDLIAVSAGHVVLAYPVAARPTDFEVRLPDGRIVHAPCAIDALGIPALLGTPALVRSTCFHCREPLAIEVQRQGPIGPSTIMVWVGRGDDLRAKAWSGL